MAAPGRGCKLRLLQSIAQGENLSWSKKTPLPFPPQWRSSPEAAAASARQSPPSWPRAARPSSSPGVTKPACNRSHASWPNKATAAKASSATSPTWPAWKSWANGVRRDYGRLDILVNNAGIGGPSGLLHELAPSDWDAIFNTNLRGVYYMLRALVPLMIATGAGHIVNISSLAGKNPLPRGAAYSASKWGLNGLTYGVAEELRAHNIRVSVICPGSVDTAFSPRRQGKETSRMLQPGDVAHAVAMLVTQEPQSFISEVLIRPTQKP